MQKKTLILVCLIFQSGALAQVPEVVATNLIVPWAMAFAPDGRIFVTERPGRVRVIDQDGLQPVPLIDMVAEVAAVGEGGLMGIAVDPDFPPIGISTSCTRTESRPLCLATGFSG